jgi:hypothetical protein
MADISVPTRTGEDVLLRTLDVRQIRRRVPGKRKASGMKSNQVILEDPAGRGITKSRSVIVAGPLTPEELPLSRWGTVAEAPRSGFKTAVFSPGQG